MTGKSLETKLAEIRAKPSARAFIIADAKDAGHGLRRSRAGAAFLSVHARRTACALLA